MASMKTDAKGSERIQLNTTIKKDVLINFKAYCKENGYPLNMILDSFMEQFVNGDFVVQIGRNKKDVKVDYKD